MIYTVIGMIVAFLAGFLTNRYYAKKARFDTIVLHKDDVEKTWHDGFEKGWAEAIRDVTTVRIAYERIFGTHKK